MPHGQKSQHSKVEGSPQAQREASDLMGMLVPMAEEGEEVAVNLIPATLMEVPAAGTPHCLQSPQRASSPPTAMVSTQESQFSQGSRSQEREGLFPRHNLVDIVSLLHDALALVPFLLLKYQMKELTTKEEMVNLVIECHQDYFPEVFSRACQCMQLVFGIEVKEVDPLTTPMSLSLLQESHMMGCLVMHRACPKQAS
uniref:MAGE domain-containing protein n=1 Tax=Castor canadensis TaxID=51338 RepID=A0A8C0ZVD8_CASCN